MNKLENWNEKTRGLYRYVICTGACYEIHIVHWCHKTDILTAKARLYIVGDWRDKDGTNLFERELLLENTVQECLEYAVKDNAENNS